MPVDIQLIISTTNHIITLLIMIAQEFIASGTTELSAGVFSIGLSMIYVYIYIYMYMYVCMC